MKKFYAITFLLLVSFFNVCAQGTPSFITDSLDNYVKRALEQW